MLAAMTETFHLQTDLPLQRDPMEAACQTGMPWFQQGETTFYLLKHRLLSRFHGFVLGAAWGNECLSLCVHLPGSHLGCLLTHSPQPLAVAIREVNLLGLLGTAIGDAVGLPFERLGLSRPRMNMEPDVRVLTWTSSS